MGAAGVKDFSGTPGFQQPRQPRLGHIAEVQRFLFEPKTRRKANTEVKLWLLYIYPSIFEPTLESVKGECYGLRSDRITWKKYRNERGYLPFGFA